MRAMKTFLLLIFFFATLHSGTALVGVLRTTPTPPPSPNLPNLAHAFASYDINVEIADFLKATYKDLGDNNGNTSETVSNRQGEYNKLNAAVNGDLGEILSSVFDIRILELQLSLNHARNMQQVIANLDAHPDAARG
jgi:hypothetical protein